MWKTVQLLRIVEMLTKLFCPQVWLDDSCCHVYFSSQGQLSIGKGSTGHAVKG